jgi:phospholipid/cholesterol/gamma-HCH transport system ATP-binding protein
MGVEVVIEGLTKSFGRQEIWRDVTLTLPPGEVSVLLGPSGTGKSVFLKSMIGLLKPERGRCAVAGVDTVSCSARQLYEVRKLFGVLFQDGALFGSMNLYDNIAFPLREHTRRTESQIRRIVRERMELVGLSGEEDKLPGQISGGMRKRAGLARALVLDPEIILCDEPDSGLDPVRTAYLSQLLIDINARLDTTILIVTHNIHLARTVPDNLGMLFRRELIGFGPRELLLTSDEPVIAQFLNGRRRGPIGMSEEKDEATHAREARLAESGHSDGSSDDEMMGVVDQLQPSPGLGARAAVGRRMERLGRLLPDLPDATRVAAQKALDTHRRTGTRTQAGV